MPVDAEIAEDHLDEDGSGHHREDDPAEIGQRRRRAAVRVDGGSGRCRWVLLRPERAVPSPSAGYLMLMM